MLSEVTVQDLEQAHADGALVVDVREPDEYQSGHVPGALSIPLGVLPVRLDELPRDRPVYVVCQSGGRSSQAAQVLDKAGHDARSVAGGTKGWIEGGKPVVSGAQPS